MGFVTSERLRFYPEITHAISMRDLQRPAEGSLALHTGEPPKAIWRNSRAFARLFEGAVAFISPMQVHGDRVYTVRHARHRGWERLDRTFEADALITDLPGVVLTVLTADCAPILLYDPVHQAIGAVHAGWRGTDAHILPKTVEAMQVQYGSDPGDLIVAIGPAIGGCCYEVGIEVAERFFAHPKALQQQPNGKYHLDTRQVNAEQLIAAGVPQSQIEISPICTQCEHERFFSYRADRTTGRFMSGIMMKPGRGGIKN